MNQQALKVALSIIAETPDLISRLGLLPNVKTPTMGGSVWWNDIACSHGWRVQHNTWTGHCRILDDMDIRQAWGTEEAVMVFFQKVLACQI
jgi:hypothetical protein